MKRWPVRALGNSGIDVNPIGFGTMHLSIQGRPSHEEALSVIHAALTAGIDFIDTADVYCLDQRDIGHSERLIAEALKTWNNPNNKHIVVATKGGLERPNGAWTTNGRPEHLKAACEASLKALATDTIEVYQLHAPDPHVPYAESVGALRELQQAGKIQHIGISNVSLEQIYQARSIVNVISVQNRCNLFDLRAFHEGIIDYCEKENIAFLPWSPMGGKSESNLIQSNQMLQKIAQEHQASPFQVALAWFLAKSSVIIPIPGSRQIKHVEDSAAATRLILNEMEITKIENLFAQ